MARKILLGLSTEGKDGVKADLDEVRKDLDELKKTVTADVRADAEQAKRDIAEVKGELDSIPKSKTIRIRVEAEQANLKSLETRLASLSSIKNDLEAAGADTSDVERRMGTLATRIENVRSRVQGLSSDFDKLSRDSSIVDKIAASMSQLVSGMLSSATSGFTGMAQAGASLVVIGPIILVIVAAVTALIVSLGEALIGVVALGVAFLAALAPIALLLVLVGVKIKDIIAQVQAQKTAVIALQQAQQNESVQRLAALSAETQATLALRQATNQLADSKLAQQSAGEQLTAAEIARQQFLQQLSGFGMSPADLTAKPSGVSVGGNLGQTQVGSSVTAMELLINQWKQVNTAVAQAKQNVTDTATQTAVAANNLSNAKQTADLFAKEGLRAFAPFASAINQTKTAVINLQTAMKNTGDSTGFLGVFNKFKHTMSTLFGPAEQAVFKGIEGALGILGDKLKPLEPAFTVLGKALGGAIVQWAKDITKPDVLNGIKNLVQQSAKFVGPLVKLFDGFMQLMLQVANDAMPFLISGVKKLGGQFADAARHPQKILDFIVKCIGQTKVWIDDIGKVASAFVQVATALKPLVGIMGGILKVIGFSLSGWAKLVDEITGGKNASQIQQALVPQTERLYKSAMGVINSPGATKKAVAQALRALASQGLTPGADPAANYGRGHPYPAHALGGVAMAATAGIFGEAGPEAIMPLAGGGAALIGERIGEYVARKLASLMPRSPMLGIAGMAPAHGGVTQHVNVRLNQGNTIPDDQHFLSVLERRLGALGGGWKGT